ncbi:acyltransferase [Conexibacter sp. SYSU D00693]|uniref:acyltransferase family protein n=1 Tax=Conexibacter sp. SYSU D00693 TaxID=2812560 RepID=UPI00196AC9E7|nr:acyltransferase [Conexibacter sp. SYSU D00693]
MTLTRGDALAGEERREAVTGARYPLVESARAIAALMVVAYHAAKTQPAGGGGQEYLEHLNVGVTVFFLISGFLLYRPFVVARLQGRVVGIRAFGLRRVMRIVPGYWVALTAVAIAGSGGAAVRDDPLTYYGFAQSFSDTTLLQGIGQAWTLSSELLFYAILPLYAIAVAFGRRGPVRWGVEVAGLLALSIVAFAYTAVYAPQVTTGESGQWVLFVLPRFLGHFAMGMALALLVVWLGTREAPPRPLRGLVARPSLTWLAAPVLFAIAVEAGLPRATRDVVDGLFAAAVLWPAVFGVAGVGVAGRVLGARWLLFAGTVSYGIYLYHFAFITRADSTLSSAGWIGLFVVGAVGGTVAGWLSWRFVEQPAIRWSRRRQAAWDGRRAQPVTA